MVTRILNVYPIKGRDWVIFIMKLPAQSHKKLVVSRTLRSLTGNNSPAPIKALGSKHLF